MLKSAVLMALVSMVSSFAAQGAFADTAGPGAPAAVPPVIDATAIKDGIDGRASADPCNDFYEFACGAWLDKTVIPADKSGVGRQVTVASDNTDIILQGILAKYARGDFSTPSTSEHQLSDLYQSCVDVDQQTSRSLVFVNKEISLIRKVKTPRQLGELAAKLNLFGVSVFFAMGASQDLNDSTRTIAELAQGGMSFESKDYYFDQDAKAAETRQKFVEHVANVFKLLKTPVDQATVIANSILKFETALAQSAYSLDDSYDPLKTNHAMSESALKKIAAKFDFAAYFSTLGLKNQAKLNVDEPEYLAGLDKVLAQTPAVDVQNYIVFRLVDSLSPRMGGEFTQESFAFWSRYLGGAQEPQPQWKLCTGVVKNLMGYGLAEAYVKTFDGSEIKRRTEAMIANIKQTFKDDLSELNKSPTAWIDDQTLAGAVEKVNAITQKVGAPDKFISYANVKTTATNVLENQLRLTIFETRRRLAKIGKPVDRTEWGMMPWEINAYYDRSNNEFVFPFGILMPPSLDFTYSDGANYGSFGGGTIGHELTHGFDNNGQKYDSKGNLRDWWTPATNAKFKEKTQCYVDQADAYKISAVNMNVDGSQTLEENLADQGGVKLGYKALDKILSTRPEAAKWQGRYSERQQYWIGYAQSWCTKSSPESIRRQMQTDPHPPAEFRVNAVLMNRPEFAQDFACSAGARMAPTQRCSLW